jgi:hypothetical protein
MCTDISHDVTAHCIHSGNIQLTSQNTCAETGNKSKFKLKPTYPTIQEEPNLYSADKDTSQVNS